jgi:hypothetical protein
MYRKSLVTSHFTTQRTLRNEWISFFNCQIRHWHIQGNIANSRGEWCTLDISVPRTNAISSSICLDIWTVSHAVKTFTTRGLSKVIYVWLEAQLFEEFLKKEIHLAKVNFSQMLLCIFIPIHTLQILK